MIVPAFDYRVGDRLSCRMRDCKPSAAASLGAPGTDRGFARLHPCGAESMALVEGWRNAQ